MLNIPFFRRKIRLFLFFVLLNFISFGAFAASVPVAVNSENKAAVTTLAPMLEKVLPAVVNVAVSGTLPTMHLPVLDKQMQRRNVEVTPKFEELGSGIIFDAEKGYILTNAHVVKDAHLILVTLKDGRKQRAKVVGYDDLSDIAVLKIEAKKLQQICFADSDQAKIGDFVSAIGSPFGLQQTVTSGIISGLERSNLGIEGYENFIQTDAPINPGNSGGALVNMHGELIGINTAIITPSPIGGSVGVGLAIPSNMARDVANQLIKYGKVERGVLGVFVQDVTPSLAEALHLPMTDGALVTKVMPSSPATKVGFRSKDVIVAINTKAIRSASQVKNIVSLQRLGSKITTKIWRDNHFMNVVAVTVKADQLRETIKQNNTQNLLAGLELRNFNQLVDNEQITGVKVIRLEDNSLAYSCGLRVGDLILFADNRQVTDINELQTIVKTNAKKVLLEILRDKGAKFFLVLE